MKNQNGLNEKQNLVVVLMMVLIAFASRMIPHPANFTAVGAIAFLSGIYFSKLSFRFLIPLMGVVLADFVLGFHQAQWFVYGGFFLATLLGTQFVESKLPYKFIGLSLGTITFYLVSNFGVWMTSEYYPKNLAGLAACFIAGLPFLPQQFVGDVVYFSGLSVAYELYLKNARSQARY